MVSQMDFLASFTSIFKINIPKRELKDSEDMLQAFLGYTQSGRSTMVREGYGNLAIVKNECKYIPAHGKLKDELYDLSRDPGEKQDLADKYPAKISELNALLNTIKSKKSK